MSKLRPKDGRGASDAVAPEELAALFEPLAGYDKLYLAVSGGCDSMALMHLIADWQAGAPDGAASTASVCVLSVDHGLRPEARGEAEWVLARARERGLAGEVLTIDAEAPESGIQIGRPAGMPPGTLMAKLLATVAGASLKLPAKVFVRVDSVE